MPKSVIIGYDILGSGLSTMKTGDVKVLPAQDLKTLSAAGSVNVTSDSEVTGSGMFMFSNFTSDPGTDYHKLGVEINGKVYDIEVDETFETITTDNGAGATVSLESVDGVLQWKIIPAARKRTTRKKKAE